MRPALWLPVLISACAATEPPVAPPARSVDPPAPPIATAEPSAPVVDPPPAPAPPETAEAKPPSLREVADRTKEDLRKAGFSSLEDLHKPTGEVHAAKVHDGFYATGPRGPNDPAVASTKDFVTRVLTALFQERFDKSPDPPVLLVLLPETNGYEKFCQAAWGNKCISPYGFYVPSERRLIVNLGPGIGTLSHELVHPIVEVDFPSAPTWLNEGIASLFEAPILPKAGGIHGAKNWRYPTLKTALATEDGRKSVSLPALFALGDEQFRKDEDEKRNYAAARYFCQWMDGRGMLFPFYRAYRDGHAADPTGARAFEKITKTTLAAANADWLKWAGSL